MPYNLNEKQVVLFGTGEMGREYIRVLNDCNVNLCVVGGSKEGCKKFYKDTGVVAIPGGVDAWNDSCPKNKKYAIIAVNIENLCEVALSLMESGIGKILIEKPAGLIFEQISKVNDKAIETGSDVYVAYNRRFFSSVLKAKEIIMQDGGVRNFVFDFTEWPNSIPDKIAEETKKKWLLANSSHVIDMAFFLGGTPKEFISYASGSCGWHPSASVFSGAGITENGALFSYNANWLAPGRWSIEVITDYHRLLFKPLETLQQQPHGDLSYYDIPLDDELDKRYKPGLFCQVNNFLNDNTEDFCSIQEQVSKTKIYYRIAGYN
jgi:predicted dehydrogenase